MTRRFECVCLLTAVSCWACGVAAQGCDTPVYRYAMYRWLPAPYRVYYLHEGEMDDAAGQLAAAIGDASAATEAPANIVFLPVDTTQNKDLLEMLRGRQAISAEPGQLAVPGYCILSPINECLFAGPLSLPDIDNLIDSPARQQVGQKLEAGNAGVYVLLTHDDAQANAQAEQVVRGVVDDVAAGKVTLYTLPSSLPEAADDAEESGDTDLEIGLVMISRNDQREKWLVDMLLAIEPDLRDRTEPMVFMIYGRGRALPPCLGKGIHRDNLFQDVQFITGACSCTVKEQNPGVDLLMRYHWEAAAESIATRFGAEEGNRYDFGGDALFPELIIPPEGELPSSGFEPASPAETDAQSQVVTTVESAATSPESPSEDNTSESTSEGDATSHVRDVTSGDAPASPLPAVAADLLDGVTPRPDPLPDTRRGEEPSSFRGMFWVGAGLLGALVALFAATFLVLRPR